MTGLSCLRQNVERHARVLRIVESGAFVGRELADATQTVVPT